MSVINQMLRDLHFAQPADTANHQRPFNRSPARSSRQWIGLISMTIALAALLFYWHATIKNTDANRVTHQTVASPKVEPRNIAPASIVESDVTDKHAISATPPPVKPTVSTLPKARRAPENTSTKKPTEINPTNTIEKTGQTFQLAQEKEALFNHQESAIARWQRHITQAPNDHDAQLIWLSYWSQRDREQAEQWAERALQHNPDRIEVRQMLAQLYVQNQKTEQAIVVLRAQQPTLIDAPDYYALLAHAHLQLQQFATAATLYQALANRFPQQGRYWAGLASSLQGLRRTREEQSAWQHALNDPQLNDTVREYALQRLHANAEPLDETR